MKIAIVVQGRFHAFDLARELIVRGHDVRVVTNYPKWAARRFGLNPERVYGFWLHGVLRRLIQKAGGAMAALENGPFLNCLFGRWAAQRIASESWDIIHVFSGVAEEVAAASRASNHRAEILLVRGSAHIRTQDRLLGEEETRAGVRIGRPSAWMIEREEREYALCDHIMVLSSFAYRSFLDHGVGQEKLAMIPLGVDTRHFRASMEVIAERRRRIEAGEPLRVLFTGTISYRKGWLDFLQIVQGLNGQPFQFRVVGDIGPEATAAVAGLRGTIEFIPRCPERELPEWYAWADVFLFPTIEDGFAMVLSQANASAIPILTTTNCSGPDLIEDGQTGWVLPIRQPAAFVERLEWCNANRRALSGMVQRIHQSFQPRDWSDVAAEFEELCVRCVGATSSAAAGEASVKHGL
jgi:glycosyltransferase involved in cell wall biosynthesis